MTNVTDAAALGGPSRPNGRRGRRTALVVVAVLAVLAVVLTGGAYAYAKQFDGRALPGTTVLGKDVAGQTPEEIAAFVAERAEAVTVQVTAGEKQVEASLAELGVTVDAQATAQRALQRDDSLPATIAAAWSGEHAVEPVVAVDEAAVTAFGKGLVPDDRTSPVNASVAFDEEQQTWNVTPGQDGQGLDPQTLVDAVTSHAPALEDFAVDQPVEQITPAITTEDAEQVVGTIGKILEQPMSITGGDGTVHEISAERRSSWLSVAPDKAESKLVLSVDEDAVREWVAARADQDAVEPKDGIEQVDEDGEVVKVVSEKKDGLEITNTDAVAEELIAALKGTTPIEAAFETRTLESKVEQVDAPKEQDDDEGEDDSPDPNAPADGEKWIDVDLTAKTVTAYVGDSPVWGPRLMVDGKEGNETVTGSFEIYLRYDRQDMTNAAYYPEGHPKYYYTPDVPWVQYFHAGYGFHGAPWRSSFGYSGSHGCINMPVSDAKWLYDWASMGTRVEVHY
ncbi:L,D-transpeptidase family protein [Brachybacterium sp. Marseille-Q7125]|uniref:L,D-transpeptidase family protein n=1 Tax=Brachybacterium sp. Marseille-Q7125 TaxID=2932815 RepID=UPI001FF1D8B5|nr:L,D-transpeptidase family protein [Brachybacterium sp. Marseille-Q7125]